MRHPFKKKWGQNFLINQKMISNIIDCLDLKITDKVLEISFYPVMVLENPI